ncbi:Pectinesterase 1 [Arabidopsis thaliana]|uniref:Pectinesterase n=3 Tax=Arabidopsis TaxID=3701 RepID=A0A178WKA7_ARATH|nr:pectinesterase, putative [Arabidopsis thaliana]KAG7649547.1 Pectinesterase inhibitor domain [Arabidopsis thaliana x Arabidopsis arenosa]OAP17893.1 PME1 [Arabidopsis thaliana]CAD5315477.1 unnamed protein product [Arabidopsis thaliana]VYS49029.1 unnamed protein product [Arabidopsis thaliana]
MDSVNSFKGYGKVDEAQDLALKKKTRKRLLLLSISVVVLIAVIIAAVVATVVHKNKNESTPSPPPELTPSTSLKAICSVTRFPESCISSISKLPSSNTTDPETLFKLSLKVIIDELDSISDLPEKLSKETEDERIKSALRVCGDLIEDALDRLNDTVSAIDDEEKKKTLSSSKIEDLKTWLSATVTDHETCFDSLDELKQNKTEYANSTITQNLKSAMSRSTEFTSNSLAIVSKILSALSDLGIPIHRRRRLMSHHHQQSVDFEKWARRRLLQTAGLKPDVTVAGDGTGDVLTVNEAVAKVPKKSLKMFVIYVKSGTYVENVVMDKSKWNVMIYGDGKGKTIISGSKNFVDGTPTYETATFAIQGKGFIMKDIGIINTAGAAKHQAVAFRSGSDFSVYYQCSFDGFQDTLYPHSNRQFYRDCDVTGTIDFIFGSAAVVFQGCKIMPRQPLSNQFNTITAQGKKDPNQSSGMSIQRCTISTNGNVIAPTYLGRPWKEFSTTVIMETVIGAVVRPSGWMSWVSGVDPPASIVYGEYKNTGPGSDVTQRVKWAGYKPVMSDAEAAKFTVATLLHGADWIPATGVINQLS